MEALLHFFIDYTDFKYRKRKLDRQWGNNFAAWRVRGEGVGGGGGERERELELENFNTQG